MGPSTERILLSLIVAYSVFIIGFSERVGASPNWWDTNYRYRQQITVTNSADSVIESGYTVVASLDISGLVGDEKAQASGNDIRVVYWDGATNVELDRLLDVAGGKVTFMTQADVPPSRIDANYWVYYGYPSVGAPPANPNNVYLVWDDFTGVDGAALNDSRWGVLEEGNAIVDIQSNRARFYSPQQHYHDAEAWTVRDFTNTTGLDISFDWISVSCGNNARWRVGLFNYSFIPPDAYPTGQNLHVSDGCTGAAGYVVYRNSTSVFSKGRQKPPKKIRMTIGTDNWAKVYKDGTLSWNGTWNRTQSDFHFLFYVGGGGTYLPAEAVTMYFDDVKIRKYLSLEPTISLGAAEKREENKLKWLMAQINEIWGWLRNKIATE